MALGPKLEFRQSQALVMTPQLMQAIKLLQLSNMDLAAYVAEELERNPLLERAEGDGGPVDGEAEPAPPAGAAEIREGDWLDAPMPETRAEIEAGLGTELGNEFQDDGRGAEAPSGDTYAASNWGGVGAGSVGGFDGEPDGFATLASAEATLAEHLEAQLALAVADPRARLIGRALIDCIEPSGYLGEPLEAIAERLGAPLAELEAVLAVIQTFEPAGVGARDLRECLAIQLRERDRFDPAMAALVDRLDLLARRDFSGLRRACGVDDDDLADMVAELRRLTPKPGLSFGGDPVQTVVPDVLVRVAPDGGWLVELNPETLPRVLVNQSYHTTIAAGAASAADKAFVAECLQTANWLTRSLEQRARTILKVAGEIVRQQDGFFTRGVEHLRPLNLRTVADAIGMHESTVSRVTANKFVATPRGIFELKYFFTSAIASTAGGEAHSAEAVRHRIRHMIETEPAQDVLSDDAIVHHLRRGGVDIARRTVAKYRESMGIPSSMQRRREKAAARH